MKIEKEEINYGLLNKVSAGLNNALGDNTGRSISRRTTHGFKQVFSLENTDISDENAEHIMHGLMLTTAGLLKSKNKGTTTGGLLLLATLVLLYQAGK